MKKYQVTVHEGYSSIVEAKNEEELYKRLPHLGVLPLRGMNRIPFTPENVKEIVEIISEEETQ